VTAAGRATLRSRAWLARGPFDCEQGTLELSDGRLRFVTTTGEDRLDVDVSDCEVGFPMGSARTGLKVRTSATALRFWFSNPYLGIGGLGGFGSARAVATEWRNTLREVC
jgi:hypothetical protein